MAETKLPEFCYTVSPLTGGVVKIMRGDPVFYGVRANATADQLNGWLGIDDRTVAAMRGGVLHGWASPFADPKNYDLAGAYLPREDAENV